MPFIIGHVAISIYRHVANLMSLWKPHHKIKGHAKEASPLHQSKMALLSRDQSVHWTRYEQGSLNHYLKTA
ncbi:hypothetical protein L1987_56001 [Smallanthus sonchifolius]|uniref:Uncharacterized protein n=1 Tax=Smallanthus sonchifolius TaxID=185202 RepID=A0ACB9EBY9_9ASTR|nr:hypothetical protein L1987_56001 [Smallanthus sonchifolius]